MIKNFLTDFFKQYNTSDKNEEKIDNLINHISGFGSPDKKIKSIKVIGNLMKNQNKNIIDNKYNKKNYINQFYSPDETI